SSNTLVVPIFLSTCGHGFEAESLNLHMQKSNLCPLCRKEFRLENTINIPLLTKLLSILSKQIIGLSEPRINEIHSWLDSVTGTLTFEFVETKLDILFRFPILI